MSDTVPTHLAHWGAFSPIVRDGADGVDGHADVTAVRPSTSDTAPSPLLGNLVGSLRHPLRIDRPYVRAGWLERGRGPDRRRGEDAFVSMSWDDVLDVLADELRGVYDTAGPDAVFGGSYGWSSAGRFHHAQSQVHRFLNTLGGYVRSVNTYSVGTSEVLLPHILGGGVEVLGALTSWQVLAEHTELMVCVGGLPAKNTAVAPGGVSRHRVSEHLRSMADRGVEFVIVGPDRADIPEELSARWLPVRPGTDTAFLLALAYVLVTERRYDAAFVRTHCTGFDRVVPYLTGKADGIAKNPAWAAALCGIDVAAITELARAMSTRRTMLTVTYALQRAEFGEQPVWAAVLVATLLGQIGLPGGGFGHGYGSMADNGLPAQTWSLPTLPQGTNPVTTAIPVARIADMLLNPGREYDYDGRRHRYPDIELIYWCGGNPFHHHQQLTKLREAWRRVNTIVVHEPYWTATARHADIVLPATVTLERDDIGASRADAVLTAMRRCADPYAEAWDDYAIFAELAARLGVAEAYTEDRTAEQWLRHLYEDWRQRTGNPDLPDFGAFWAAGSVTLPEPQPSVLFADFRRDPMAHPLRTPSGRIELYSATIASFDYEDCPGHPAWLAPAEWHGSPRAEWFPLVLLANNPATRLHSQLDFGPYSQASKVAGREPIRMHPADAASRGIVDGDLVRVYNDRGACLAGAVLDDDLLPGVVQLSTGAWFTPVPGTDPVLCTAGSVNVLTRDTGSSRLSQGCSGSRVLVEVARWSGPVPPAPS
ncbi:molybdopterin-dependent oxidoreductase [Haloechinothrix salitolerans]|uniref:Molybdopterin-dependent oxidoreductase n=1 Tax=Haloechinothrix salitolerans TaxID=926830 RepID=A0ABW2C353_9PSEU